LFVACGELQVLGRVFLTLVKSLSWSNQSIDRESKGTAREAARAKTQTTPQQQQQQQQRLQGQASGPNP